MWDHLGSFGTGTCPRMNNHTHINLAYPRNGKSQWEVDKNLGSCTSNVVKYQLCGMEKVGANCRKGKRRLKATNGKKFNYNFECDVSVHMFKTGWWKQNVSGDLYTVVKKNSNILWFHKHWQRCSKLKLVLLLFVNMHGFQ